MSSGEYITGEASPYYLYHPHVARRVFSVVPDPKLIVLLRDPVDRAISHYWHMVNSGREDLSIEEAFECEPERLEDEKYKLHSSEGYYSFNHQMFSYLDRGKYLEQIERFREYFDEGRILILKSERLFNETQDTYNEVTDFLGIDRHTLDVKETKNEGEYKRETPISILRRLEEYYSEQKAQIEEELGIRFE
jgi:hypothetical protein